MMKVAAACYRQLCKKHCREHDTPCGFKAHDKEPRSLVLMTADPLPHPSHLTHPTPVVPSTPHIARTQDTPMQAARAVAQPFVAQPSVAQPSVAQPTRQYRNQMSDDMGMCSV